MHSVENKTDFVKFYIYLALTLTVMAVIFAFSAQTAGESNEVSGSVLTWIAEHIIRSPQTSHSLNAMKLLRKLAHFSIYLCLGVSTALTVRAWRRPASVSAKTDAGGNGKRDPAAGAAGWRRFLCAWGIAVCYACTDEFHQYFVPGRSSELRDVCIDGLGALTGALCVWLACGLRRRFSRFK